MSSGTEGLAPGRSLLHIKLLVFWQGLGTLGRASLLIIVLFCSMAVFAPWVTLHPADRGSGPALAGPGGGHILGTDDLGVDIWSMLAFGARTSLIVALAAACLAGLGGSIVGTAAGYQGGWWDTAVMRAADVLIILPELPVVIVFAAFLGPSLGNIILVLVGFSWTRPARIVRAQVLRLKEEPYIRMAGLYGASPLYLMVRHLLPEVLPIVLVQMVQLAGRAVVVEASLAFLGLGDPTNRSWGMMINQALDFPGIHFTPYWQWWLLPPALALAILVTALAFLARELEPMADPRMRRS